MKNKNISPYLLKSTNVFLSTLAKYILVFSLTCFTIPSNAVSPPPPVEQSFTQTLQAIPTEQNQKIEIVEFFWYGCPHCYEMEPMLDDWIKKLPADIQFKRIPATPRPDWIPLAKAYYAIDMLNLTNKLHRKLFNAVHKEKSVNPYNDKSIYDWIIKESGIEQKTLSDALNSFSLSTKLNQGIQIFKASGSTGVPSFVIDGKYLTSSTMAGGNQEVIKTMEYIISNLRSAKKKK